MRRAVTHNTYARAVEALLDVFEQMIEDAEACPRKWDEEYAEHAVNDCIDRMFCAGPLRPSDELGTRYQELGVRARPFLDEGVPLPGSREAKIAELEVELYERDWPEEGGWDAAPPEMRFNYHALAEREIQKEVKS